MALIFISALGYSQKKNLLQKTATYTLTLRNTQVNFTTWDMNSATSAEIHNFRGFYQNPPDEMIVEDSSTNYNCFGYALGNSAGWIDPDDVKKFFDEENGYGDGSYSQTTDFDESEIIIYDNFIHAAVKAAPKIGYPRMVISKWRCADVVYHPLDQYNPYQVAAVNGLVTFYALAHDVRNQTGNENHYDNVAAAIEAANSDGKNHQIIKVYKNSSLNGSIENETHSFHLRSGSTTDLNGYYLKCYGSDNYIIINGSILPSNHCRINKSNGALVGLYSTLNQAIDNAESEQIITVYGSHSLQSTSAVSSGVTLQLTSGASISGYTLTVNGALVSNASAFSCPVVINGSASCQWSTFSGGIAVNNTTSASFYPFFQL